MENVDAEQAVPGKHGVDHVFGERHAQSSNIGAAKYAAGHAQSAFAVEGGGVNNGARSPGRCADSNVVALNDESIRIPGRVNALLAARPQLPDPYGPCTGVIVNDFVDML